MDTPKTYKATIIQCSECGAFATTPEGIGHSPNCSIPQKAILVSAIRHEAIPGYLPGFIEVSKAFAMFEEFEKSQGHIHEANRRAAVNAAVKWGQTLNDGNMAQIKRIHQKRVRLLAVTAGIGWALVGCLSAAILILGLSGRL